MQIGCFSKIYKVPLFINVAKICQKPVEITIPVSKRSLTAQILKKSIILKGAVNPDSIYHGLLLSPNNFRVF